MRQINQVIAASLMALVIVGCSEQNNVVLDPIRMQELLAGDPSVFDINSWHQSDNSSWIADSDDEALLLLSLSESEAAMVYSITDVGSAVGAMRKCLGLGVVGFNNSDDVNGRLDKAVENYMNTRETQTFRKNGLSFDIATVQLKAPINAVGCRVRTAL